MEITLDSGERIAFSWRASGELHVALIGEPTGKWDEPTLQYPEKAGCTLRGDELIRFLEMVSLPLLRRALAIATEFPHKNTPHTTRHTK